MGNSRQEIIYLSLAQLKEINHDMIFSYGGFYQPIDNNVQNENSLNYLIEAVEAEIYGRSLHPNNYSKAAAYMFYIIRDHVFYDGNKRTGTQAAVSFLEINGINLKDEVESDDLVTLAIDVADNNMSFEELEEWFQSNTVFL